MLTLIGKARRRLLYNELLSQGINAVSAGLVAVILLLILGTEVLNWYVAGVIPAVAITVALYRVHRRAPRLYESAQIVDRQLNLADSLSTAVFFGEATPAHATAEMRRLQREQAERVAVGADVRRAVPYTLPRTAYAMAALILVASSLFALRYGLTRRLDLSEPMARILQQALGLDGPQTANNPPRKNPNLGGSPQEEGDSPLAAQQPPDDSGLQAGDPLDETSDSKDSSANKAADKKAKNQDGKADSQNGDEQGPGDERSQDQDASNRSNADKNGQNEQTGGQNPGSNSSSSLLSKMKEAMQNLLSSLKQQPSGSNAEQQQNNSAQNGQQKGKQNAGKQQKAEKQGGQAGGDEQEPDQANESQQAENSQGKGDDARPSNKQPGGGIGSRDGSKDVRQAEQLAAMGKISQIIGKRSANLSGEATVEVQSTVQQLRTAYTDRTAQHADAGAEIGRDEIPAALESYVEQYFEQVRKQPAAKK